jgi:hypothetical protein
MQNPQSKPKPPLEGFESSVRLIMPPAILFKRVSNTLAYERLTMNKPALTINLLGERLAPGCIASRSGELLRWTIKRAVIKTATVKYKSMNLPKPLTTSFQA